MASEAYMAALKFHCHPNQSVPNRSSSLHQFSNSISTAHSTSVWHKLRVGSFNMSTRDPSARWCPTHEQLLILQRMYRGGMRRPNAVQIQQITAFLSPYGRIEGKNVFYWFQNHKARERQRLRKMQNQQQAVLQQAHQLIMPVLLPMEMPFPAPPPLPPPPSPFLHPAYFFHQVIDEKETPAMNLVCEMNTFGSGEEMGSKGAMSTCYGDEWMVGMAVDGAVPAARDRPLKTLDLFPTESRGWLRENTGDAGCVACGMDDPPRCDASLALQHPAEGV